MLQPLSRIALMGSLIGVISLEEAASAQHFKMPDPVVRDADLPVGTLDGRLPRPTTSFGAATHDGWVYVIGGYTGPPHDYFWEAQEDDFYRVNLHDRTHVEYLPHHDRLQSCSLEAHDGRLIRIGGMMAQNGQGQPQELLSLDTVTTFDPESRSWSDRLPQLPEGRSSHDSVVIGSRLFVVGGWSMDDEFRRPTWHDEMLVLDLGDDDATWTSIKTPFERRALACTTTGKHVVAIGGIGADRSMSQSVDLYDLETGTWSKGPEYPGVAFGMAAEAMDDTILASGADGKVFQWAPGDDEWTQVGTLTFPRFFHQIAIAGPEDAIFVGGMSRGVRPSHLEHLSLASQTPTATCTRLTIPSPMPSKNRQAMFLHDGWVYLFGGNTSTGQHDFEPENFLDTGYRLSLANLNWEPLGEYPHARQTIQTCVTPDGGIYAIGGFGHDGEVARTWTEGYRYDLQTDDWHADGPDMPVSRSQFGLTEHDGTLWIFGGLDYDPRRERGDQFRHLLEVVSAPLDQESPAFQYDGVSLTGPRRAFAGAKLDDRYYLIGGMREDFQLVEGCEYFDFTTETFQSIPAPRAPRLSAELVALDGRLYLAGGTTPDASGDFAPNTSIECFDPATNQWTTVMEDMPFPPRHMRMMAHRGRLLLFSSHIEDTDSVELAIIDPGFPELASAITQVEDLD